jgi:hypothetical protein
MAAQFRLTPAERFYGVREDDAGLVFRVVGRARVGGALTIVLSTGFAVVAPAAGFPLLVPLWLGVILWAAAALRPSVVVGERELVVQNLRRRWTLDLEQVRGFDHVEVAGGRWSLLSPTARGTPAARWRLPRVHMEGGEVVDLEALACTHTPYLDQPSIAEIRLGALERWIAEATPGRP